jgi:4-aminobutyrate aminotransferase-like enzyme
MAIAAAHAVLDVMQEEKLVERGDRLGAQLRERLLSLKARQPRMAEVRGLGAMLAVEFCQPGGNTPDPDFTQHVRARALERGLMLLTCGVHANVIRFLFPLTIQDAVFAEALSILDGVLAD